MANIETTKAILAQQGSQNNQSPTSLQILIEQSAKELGRALPEHMRPERLVRIALTCIRLNPDLAKCTPQSFLGALFTAAQLGLEPVAGRAYILPYNNKRKIDNEWTTVKEAQFMIGYKGLAELFYRHEKAIQVTWGAVKANDEFDYEYGTNEFLKHKPSKLNRGETIGFWVMANLSGGGKPFLYMSLDECMDHGRKHSKTWISEEWDYKQKKMVPCTPHFQEKSPWNTNPDSMCLKTVLIQLMKLMPLSSELQTAVSVDESSRDYRKGIEDMVDIPTTTTWERESEKIEQPKKEIEFESPKQEAKQ